MSDAAQAGPATVAERGYFLKGLAAVLCLSALVWTAYGLAQTRYDPYHERPAFDAGYYVEWSDAMLQRDGADPRFQGAFYRAPLYPLLLGFLRGVIGAELPFIFWIQLAAALAATAGLAQLAFRWAGAVAGIGCAALLGAYHPWLFFSARFLAETCSIVLLVAALRWVDRRGLPWTVLAGIFAGLAALARPNLLLVVLGWAAWAVYRRERAKAASLLLAAGIIVAPVSWVNWHRSGHVVPVSANAGLTLYHGNGPGAEGVLVQPQGMSGPVAQQRAHATALASRQSGRELDPVRADRYWGRQALQARLDDPGGSLVLLWNRLLLSLGTREIALDEAPEIDPNPWARGAIVPFALLVALAAVAAARGPRNAIGAWTWIAIVACAATPLVFYVSSRYRLPLAVLLAVPAGVGLSEVWTLRRRALGVALAGLALSLAAPWIASISMPRTPGWNSENASGYARLAQAARDRAANDDAASAKRWRELANRFVDSGNRADPASPELLCVVARIALDDGRVADAESAWLAAWTPGVPGSDAATARKRARAVDARMTAAINLSAIWIRDGRAAAAADLLGEALELAPRDENGWNNRIAALIAAGRPAEARRAIDRARTLGVDVQAELVAALADAGGAP